VNAKIATVVVVTALAAVLPVDAQIREAESVAAANNALKEFMAMPNQNLPQAMLAKAQGIVIVPDMLKVGLVAGLRRGKGIAVVRDELGVWQPPVFLTMTGGSLGFQAGVQATDVILVFTTRKSVNGLLSGKFTIGLDAAAAAGPLGRQATAATDGQLQAEILSYSRSRGLFAGAAVDGSVLQIDAVANQEYYGSGGQTLNGTPNTAPALPPTASQLLTTLATLAPPPATLLAGPATASTTGAQLVPGSPAAGTIGSFQPAQPGSQFPAAAGTGAQTDTGTVSSNPPRGTSGPNAMTDLGPLGQPPAADAAAAELEATRLELVEVATQLGAMLNDTWRQYLALPKGVLSGTGAPTAESVQQALARYERVAKDEQYRVLIDRNEFQRAVLLLRLYIQQLRASAPASRPATTSEMGAPAKPTTRY